MMATTYTGCIDGVEAAPIQVEVKIIPGGFPGFRIVGLAEGAVKESKVRVCAALSRCGYHFGEENVTVNLAPADVRKSGSAYDLAIATALLIARGIVPQERASRCFMLGELSLHADLRAVSGALPMALCARRSGRRGLLLPAANVPEAAVIPGVDVRGAATLDEAVAFLRGDEAEAPAPARVGTRAREEAGAPDAAAAAQGDETEMADVRGQELAKRALAIAAAGGHNVLMTGAAGSGKTMLARAFPSILPPLTLEESIETTAVYSVAGLLGAGGRLMTRRPLRAPHHATSYGGLLGGGSPPRPGEVTLAHNGVLFLDELPEYSRYVLDMLRQPIEEGHIVISRAWGQVRYPARFTLVAAMNPCPCGNRGSLVAPCRCSPEAVRRYAGRVSGPILDRIDMRVAVPFQGFKVIAGPRDEEGARRLREDVLRARRVQSARFAPPGGYAVNAGMKGRLVERFCALDERGRELLGRAVDRFGLSARAYTRVLKVARTIADMEEARVVGEAHVREALGYRVEAEVA